jgi:hypothetical protein
MRQPRRNLRVQPITPQPQNQPPTNTRPPWYRNLFGTSMSDWHPGVLLVVSVLVAIGARFVASLLLKDSEIGFLWQELIKMAVAFLILGAIASLSKESKIGLVVAIFVVLISLVNIVNHDFSEDRTKKVAEEGIKYDRSKADYRLLYPGKTYAYELQAGEETPWRSVPEGKKYGYGMYSESYDYIIIYSDGTTYPGGSDTKIPHKEHMFFKVRANSEQTVFITVF